MTCQAPLCVSHAYKKPALHCRLFAVTNLFPFLITSNAAQAQSLRPVAIEGHIAPGTSQPFQGLYNYLSFNGYGPTINNAGQITVSIPPTALNASPRHNWSEGSGSLALSAYLGMTIPDYGNMSSYSSGRPQLDDAGRTQVGASTVTASGVFRLQNGVFTPAALLSQTGNGSDPTPGSNPPTSFLGIGPIQSVLQMPSLNRISGDMGMYARVVQSGVNYSGVVINTPQGFNRLVAYSGMPAPGTGGVFNLGFGDQQSSSEMPFSTPAINRLGFAAFKGAAPQSGIWAEDQNGLALVAYTGTPAPGFGPGATFAQLSDWISMNDDSKVAFRGTTSNSTTGPNGIWTNSNGPLSLVVREGIQIDGMVPGETIDRVSIPAISPDGRTFFGGVILGGSGSVGENRGLWVQDASGSLMNLVRKGTPVPGDPPGSAFSGISMGRSGFVAPFEENWNVPVINSLGHAVFNSAQGIWMSDLDGNLTPLMRPNGFVEIGGQMHRILSAWFNCGGGNGADGQASCLNDNDQLAVLADIEGVGRGLYVLTVPEPAAFGLLIALSICLRVRRRIGRAEFNELNQQSIKSGK